MNKSEGQHGFFPGTFDPIHSGHLKIADTAAQFVDKVWLLPNPVNSKSKPNTTPLDIRRDLVNVAIADNPKLSMPNDEAWEEYVKAYQEHGVDEAIIALSKHLTVDPVHIVGQDVYEKRPHTGRKVIVISRGDRGLTKDENIRILPAVGKISSTEIREKLVQGLEAKELPSAVFEEINKRGLYKSIDENIDIRAVKKWISEKIDGWKTIFDPNEIEVELGGSLVSGLFVQDGAEKYDADVKFIVKDPQNEVILQKIQAVTGLEYRKTIRIKELPTDKNTATMMEKTFIVPELKLPVDVEGCVRQGPYLNSHKLYTKFFSAEEMEEIRKKKKELRKDKESYKKFKYELRDELMRRAKIAPPL